MRKVLPLALLTLGSVTACSHSNSHATASKGMTCIGPHIFVDSKMPEKQRKQFLQTVKYSKVEISKFFGGMKSSPDIYACSTKKCLKQFGGIPAIAKSIDDNKVILSSRGLDNVTLTHELAHVEFHKRLGTPHVWNKVPMWFDEGLAALACKDPNYAKRVPMMPLDDLSSQNQWVNAIRKKKPAYNVAKQAVESWYRGAGTQGLHNLISHLQKGGDFSLASPSDKSKRRLADNK